MNQIVSKILFYVLIIILGFIFAYIGRKLRKAEMREQFLLFAKGEHNDIKKQKQIDLKDNLATFLIIFGGVLVGIGTTRILY